MNSPEKPTKVKPAFYAFCYEDLMNIAKSHGYNLAIHGSLARDMDLVAIPWSDNPMPRLTLLWAFERYFKGPIDTSSCDEAYYLYSKLPGGRHSFVINLNRGGAWNGYVDGQWYLDISFTPLVK